MSSTDPPAPAPTDRDDPIQAVQHALLSAVCNALSLYHVAGSPREHMETARELYAGHEGDGETDPETGAHIAPDSRAAPDMGLAVRWEALRRMDMKAWEDLTHWRFLAQTITVIAASDPTRRGWRAAWPEIAKQLRELKPEEDTQVIWADLSERADVLRGTAPQLPAVQPLAGERPEEAVGGPMGELLTAAPAAQDDAEATVPPAPLPAPINEPAPQAGTCRPPASAPVIELNEEDVDEQTPMPDSIPAVTQAGGYTGVTEAGTRPAAYDHLGFAVDPIDLAVQWAVMNMHPPAEGAAPTHSTTEAIPPADSAGDPRPHGAPPTAADLEEAKNAALKCASCASNPAGYLGYAGVDGFFRRTAAALSGQPAIDRVSRLLVGESLAEFAGMRRASFHQIAWELAFQVHQSFEQGLRLMDAAGHKPPWDPELVKTTILGVLSRFEARNGPDLLPELRDKICFEFDRALNRLAVAAAPSTPTAAAEETPARHMVEPAVVDTTAGHPGGAAVSEKGAQARRDQARRRNELLEPHWNAGIKDPEELRRIVMAEDASLFLVKKKGKAQPARTRDGQERPRKHITAKSMMTSFKAYLAAKPELQS